MRKIIISCIGVGLATIIIIVINKALETEASVKVKTILTQTNADTLPLFEFYTLEGLPYSKYSLKKNQSLIIVYFDPDCGLCQKSGEVFSTFKKIHASSQVLFVSHNTKEKIEDYRLQYNLDAIANVKFLQCNAEDFYKLFNETSTPSYLIYDTKQNLVKIINDDIPVKTILRYIKAAQTDA